MSFTERYIKMCEKAEEIQEYKRESRWQDGDWIYDYYLEEDMWENERKYIILVWNGLKCYTGSHNWHENWEEPSPNAIWLPTQEQLQEMAYESGHPGYLLDKFVWWVIDYEKYRYSGEISYPSLEDFVCRDFSSMNELWLAFVMWKKYHKVWDDEKEEWTNREVFNEY